MKNENNFEVKDIDLNEAEALVEMKDEELKQVTGGLKYSLDGNWHWLCGDAN